MFIFQGIRLYKQLQKTKQLQKNKTNKQANKQTNNFKFQITNFGLFCSLHY